MKRRTFLASTAGAGLAALAAGCQPGANADLKIAMLAGSVPVQLIKLFQNQQKPQGTVSVSPQDSLIKLYGQLQTWHGKDQASPATASAAPVTIPTWVTLGDYWLASAIQQGLIQPIDPAPLANWEPLPEVWPQLVRRDDQGRPAQTGSVWGIPYRWSSLGLLYNAEKLGSSLTAWADLLRPDLKRQIILPDHPRLVIGLGLKAMGASANVEDPSAAEGLGDFLTDLHQQVLSYDSDYYLESLIEGNALAVVGWSDEIQAVARQYRNLVPVFPAQGTLLSADVWVKPKTAPAQSPLASAWLDFCLSPDFATQLAIYSQGAAPPTWGLEPQTLPEPLNQTPDRWLSPQGQAQSEFLAPLSETAQARYDQLWQRLRS